jgi:hypothetical protein
VKISRSHRGESDRVETQTCHKRKWKKRSEGAQVQNRKHGRAKIHARKNDFTCTKPRDELKAEE